MGSRTPLWAAVFAAGVALAILGVAVSRTVYLAGGVILGLVGAGGQAFLPGETTARERQENRMARQEADEGSWPGEEHSDIDASPGPEPEEDRPPREHGAGDGTTRGKCSECGAMLTLSDRRPVRATCPNCGHTRLIEE